jgi:hypothetical protein
MNDASFGYAPGDKVIVFNDRRIHREDLVFDSVRGGEQGVTLRAPDGKRVRFTRTGRLYGGGSSGHVRIYRKEEQDGIAFAHIIGTARRLCGSNVAKHAEDLGRLAYRDIRNGDTKSAREHALATLAALDTLDEKESEHGNG